VTFAEFEQRTEHSCAAFSAKSAPRADLVRPVRRQSDVDLDSQRGNTRLTEEWPARARGMASRHGRYHAAGQARQRAARSQAAGRPRCVRHGAPAGMTGLGAWLP